MKQLIGIILGLALVGGIYGYLQFSKTADSTDDLKTEITMSAASLFEAFENDEQTANKKYLDKIVEVTGKVLSTKTQNEKTTISLETNDMLGTIFCEMESEPTATPKNGEEVKIKGICTGYLTDVVLVRSVLIK